MRSVKIISLILVSLAIITQAACTRVLGGIDTVATNSAVYTAQAQTLQAIVTEAALTATLNTVPTSAPPATLDTTASPALPTVTHSFLATATTVPTFYCNAAAFIRDETVPDGTTFAPGAAFTKTWRLKNVGTCSWASSYDLVFSSGDAMSGPAAVHLGTTVAPGDTVNVSVNLSAPGATGHFRGNWLLRSTGGTLFGIGPQANGTFYVDINVSGAYVTVLDFVADFCDSTTWSSGADASLPCPGSDGANKGYVLKINNPKLENGTVDTQPGLLTVPQNVNNGYITGKYPAFAVQSGDRLRTIVNCQYNSAGCDVYFQVKYQIGGGEIKNLWTFHERYEGQYFQADLNLNSLAGQNVKFYLHVDANGSPNGDRALWVAPRIVRLSSLVVASKTPTKTATAPSPTPTQTSTGPVACNWVSYIGDVTIPDGTDIVVGGAFTKTWRLKNIGTCTWTTSYSLVYVSGDQMGGASPTALPANVLPGQTIDLPLNLTAPVAPGHYKGFWQLRTDGGVLFGIGASAVEPFWVDINAVPPTSTPTETPTPTATP